MKLWVLTYDCDQICGVTDSEKTADAWKAVGSDHDAEEFTLNEIFESGYFDAKRWYLK